MDQRLTLRAPLFGYLVPLEQVPDPVFSQKLAGDGVALDPVSQSLKAPCDGRVTMVHPASHALTLAVAGGVELLLHIGLDTINLNGKGFTPRVKAGDSVTAGTRLIDFDADFVATHAKSLLSMILVTNPDRLKSIHPASGSVVEGNDAVLELELADGVLGEPQAGETAAITSETLVVRNRDGLHARPAAVLANLAKKYASTVWLECGGHRANAKSVTALMALNVRHSDNVRVQADGPDAQLAVKVLSDLILSGAGEGAGRAPTPARAPASQCSDDPNLLVGISASPGLAVGKTFRLRRTSLEVPETAEDFDAEVRKLASAIHTASDELQQLQGQVDPSQAAIFAAHQEILDDPELIERVRGAIREGKSAPFAWQQVVETRANELAEMNNALLAARAADLRDVRQRVMRLLTGAEPAVSDIPPSTILIAEEITPSEMANLDRGRVRGICTTLGSTTSHAAIIARSLDMPVVVGIQARALEIPDGTPVILDAIGGSLRVNPPAEEVSGVQVHQDRMAAQSREYEKNAGKPATTLDGCRIEVVANIGGQSDATSAMELGGEGVGLLRTEFLFLGRDAAPTEDEQTELYSAIARTVGSGRPLVIRTLDVGGDKPVAYLPIPKEENPFLGERGLRVGLNRPELLRTQLRAILRSAGLANVRVMFPMVATLTEWRAARSMFEEEASKLGVPPVPLGIMVEIPSAALMSEQFAREAEFFSIGTNDLTQYTLAMDRGHPKLAPHVDGLNPAVLRLIAMTVDGARTHGRWVGVCGGLASDSQAVPLLMGLGITELSVSVPAIPAIKAQIRSLRMADCRDLAQRALGLETAAQVRSLVTKP